MKKCFSGILLLGLICILCTPAKAQAPNIGPAPGGGPIGGVTKGEVIGAVLGVVAVVAVVAILVVHQSHKPHTITGCVASGPNGMTLTDEKNKRVYTLSGETAGVKPGERFALEGKKISPNAGKPLLWETKAVASDLGACQP
jgi:hypothetical protein